MSEFMLLLLPDNVGFTSWDLTIVDRLQGELRFLRDVPLRSSKKAKIPNSFLLLLISETYIIYFLQIQHIK